jgi:hypothetical protein
MDVSIGKFESMCRSGFNRESEAHRIAAKAATPTVEEREKVIKGDK